MLKSALFVFLFSSFLARLDCADVPVKRGEEVILECYGPKYATTRLLRWYKSDVKSDFYVFFFRDGKSYENYQDPHFKDRVKLKDPEMKNGDFSVILKDVTMRDTGRYECYAGYNDQGPQLINITNLKVEEKGQRKGTTHDGGEEEKMIRLKREKILRDIRSYNLVSVVCIIISLVFLFLTWRADQVRGWLTRWFRIGI
ncbi:unnamed protein product [Oreochromis niloticus]|nr:unnamed protein product [Mustela putorius furo]